MFMSLVSHILSAWFAFLLPSFSTYKALARLPHSVPDVQRWGMYWSVVGAFVALEYVAEWVISWFPFYWELKTLFLLYLALPQTQGSTYIYQNYLGPFLAKNEAALDENIIAIQQNAFTFVQQKLTAILNLVLGALNKQGAGAQGQGQHQGGQAAGNPLQAVTGLWQQYGGLLGALQPAAASGVNPSPVAPNLTSRRSGASGSSIPSTPSGDTRAPSFPVPQHYTQSK